MKKLISSLIVLTMAFSMAGCGGKTTSQPQSSQKPEAQQSLSTEAEVEKPKEDTENEIIHIVKEDVNETVYNPESYKLKAEIKYDRFSLTDEYAKKYPKLAKALDEYSSDRDEYFNNTLTEMVKMYDEACENMDEEPYFNMEEESVDYVLRADKNAVSLYREYYEYWGGAHPMYGYLTENFDPVTGERINFSDVVNDTDTFFKVVDRRLSEEYSEIYEYMESIDDFVKETDFNQPEFSWFTWNIDYEGLTVYFNPYVLGSFAMGAQNITVYFDEMPELFNEKYLDVPFSYVIPMKKNLPGVLIDTDGDGAKDFTFAELDVIDMDSDEFVMNVYSGDRSLAIENYLFDMDKYIICKDGKYYLYLFESFYDGDVKLICIDLNTLTYDEDKYVSGFLDFIDENWEDDEDKTTVTQKERVFVDPEDFDIRTTLYILGVNAGRTKFYADENGIPTPNALTYDVHTNTVLRPNTNLPCDIVDDNGNIEKSSAIKTGKYFYMIKTDGNSWADLQEVDADKVIVEDGYDGYHMHTEKENCLDSSKPIYRVYVDTTDYPHLIDEKNEEDVFEGLFYAG